MRDFEEAQAYLPQMVRGEEARMVGVFEDIGKVGRNYGIGSSLISQRPQAINKDVLNQVEVLLAFQTNGPQERKAIAGWTAENTDAGAAMIQELPKLHVGHALAWSPQWLRVAKQIHITERVTYDASSTPTQSAKAIRPKVLAPADLAALGEQITATIEKAKQDDPRELKKLNAEKDKRIKELEASSARQQQPDRPAKEKRVEVLTEADRELLRKTGTMLEQMAFALGVDIETRIGKLEERMATAVTTFHREAHAIHEHARAEFEARLEGKQFQRVVDKLTTLSPEPRALSPTAEVHKRTAVSAVRPPVIRPETNSDGGLPPAALRMLDVVAGSQPGGIDRTVLAICSGYSVGGGGFRSTLSALNSAGLIDKRQDGHIALSGQAEAQYFPKGTPRGLTTEEVRDVWRQKLTPAEWRMLEVVIAAGPRGLTRADLAEKSNYDVAGGGFRSTLSGLSTNALIWKRGGLVGAHEVLVG